MNTFHRVVCTSLILITSVACAGVRSRGPTRTSQDRRFENAIVADLIIARMDRNLSYPRLLGDLDRAVDRARTKLAVDGDHPNQVQDWLLGQSRRLLPGRLRVWKAEIESEAELRFPPHMLDQRELEVAFLTHHRPAGGIVVMVIYRHASGPRSVVLADGRGPNQVREVQGRHIESSVSVASFEHPADQLGRTRPYRLNQR